MITYKETTQIKPEELADVFRRSGIRRPYQDLERIRMMIEHCQLLITAWDGDLMIGAARALTDYSYCCYLSDLAVDRDYQQKGIGKRLVELVQEKIGDTCALILISAPEAVDYYRKLGFERSDRAFIIPRTR